MTNIKVIKRELPNVTSSWIVIECKGNEQLEVFHSTDYNALMDYLEFTQKIPIRELKLGFESLLTNSHTLVEFGSNKTFVLSGHLWN